MWQTIVLNIIGGLFPTENCVVFCSLFFSPLPPCAQKGASIVVHGVGNNLIKVWLSTADKEAVAKTKSFLVDILDAEDYVTDKVTFVPHKLVLPSNNQKIPTSGATPPESCPLHVCVFFVSVHYFPHFQRPYRIPQKTWQQQLHCLGCFLFFLRGKEPT